MEITAITPQVKDKTRCNIEVDGRFYCGLNLETVMQNRLRAGLAVTEEQLGAMQLESEKQTALDKALRHISVSMKTEAEISDFLAKKGYLPAVAEYVTGKMREHRFLDDEAYAVSYAEGASARKGKRLIAAELKRKGVSEENIEKALSTLGDEEESAKAILDKYLHGKPLGQKTFQKAYAYLLGKGFGYETVRSVLSSLGAEDE